MSTEYRGQWDHRPPTDCFMEATPGGGASFYRSSIKLGLQFLTRIC